MSIDAQIISYAIRHKGLTGLQQMGVSEGDFVDEYKTIWHWLCRMKRDHDAIPSKAVANARFPDLDLPRVAESDLAMLIHNLRQRRKFMDLLLTLNDTASRATSWEHVDDLVQELQGRLNGIAYSGGQSHMVDLFSEEMNQRVIEEIRSRRSGRVTGIKTGLDRFDRMAGGMMKQKMVVLIGRPGIGKSWLDLLFVATAVVQGYTFMLYPLEMSIYETAFRLYTLFSQQMFGADRAIRNLDLSQGKVTKRKIVRLLGLLEDRFQGRLFVADVASLSDPYTNERIEAEVEVHRPDGFWVDYLTLLKPQGNNGVDDWGAVRQLSNGIKNTAMRRDVVGGCSAQVNREALRSSVWLPRLEHIAYGDSIGQDADTVLSLNRRQGSPYLDYALVKNRGGPEFGKTRVRFNVDIGDIAEADEGEGQEEDDAEEAEASGEE